MLDEGDDPVAELLNGLGSNGRGAALFQILAATDEHALADQHATTPDALEKHKPGKLVPIQDDVGGEIDDVRGQINDFVKTAGADFPDDQAEREKNREIASDLFKNAGWAIATGLLCRLFPMLRLQQRCVVEVCSIPSCSHTPERRIIETTQFVFDVATGSADLAKKSAVRVRFMHEIVRRERQLAMKHDPETLGKPINQQHLLLTILSFSTMVTDGLRSMGLDVSDEQEAAWLAVWREIGCYLGIKKEHLALVDTPAHAQATLQQLRAVAWDMSDPGTALGKSLVDLLQELVPVERLFGSAGGHDVTWPATAAPTSWRWIRLDGPRCWSMSRPS